MLKDAETDVRSHGLRLRHPLYVLMLAVAGLLLFSGILLFANLYPNGTGGLWTNAIFAAGWALGLYLLVIYVRDRPVISEEGISCSGILPMPRDISWRDVSEIRFDRYMGWFVIRDNLARTIYVSVLLIGLPEFAKLATTYVRRSAISPEGFLALQYLAKRPASLGR